MKQRIIYHVSWEESGSTVGYFSSMNKVITVIRQVALKRAGSALPERKVREVRQRLLAKAHKVDVSIGSEILVVQWRELL